MTSLLLIVFLNHYIRIFKGMWKKNLKFMHMIARLYHTADHNTY